jgi:hypothetical protein
MTNCAVVAALIELDARVVAGFIFGSFSRRPTMRIPTLACTVVISGYALACPVVAAQDAPKENKGYTTLKTVVIDLGAEIPSMAGWQLRLRMLKIEPDGHIGLHEQPADRNFRKFRPSCRCNFSRVALDINRNPERRR